MHLLSSLCLHLFHSSLLPILYLNPLFPPLPYPSSSTSPHNYLPQQCPPSFVILPNSFILLSSTPPSFILVPIFRTFHQPYHPPLPPSTFSLFIIVSTVLLPWLTLVQYQFIPLTSKKLRQVLNFNHR